MIIGVILRLISDSTDSMYGVVCYGAVCVRVIYVQYYVDVLSSFFFRSRFLGLIEDHRIRTRKNGRIRPFRTFLLRQVFPNRRGVVKKDHRRIPWRSTWSKPLDFVELRSAFNPFFHPTVSSFQTGGYWIIEQKIIDEMRLLLIAHLFG